MIDVSIGVGWLAFWIFWLAAAVGAKSGRGRWGRSVGMRLVVVVPTIVLLQLRPVRMHRTHSVAQGVVGLAFFVTGLAVAIWARIHLGRNWGSPMSEKDEPELVTSGPYRWVRNPIYTGFILAIIGTAVAINIYWLSIAALLGGYFVYAAVNEQRFMSAQFPEQYPAYRRSTKLLVPFVF